MRTLLCFVATWTFATGLFCLCLQSAWERKAARPKPQPMPDTVTSENGRIRVVVPRDAGTEQKEVVKLVLEMRLYAEDGTYAVVDETTFLNTTARDTRPGKEADGDLVAGTWR